MEQRFKGLTRIEKDYLDLQKRPLEGVQIKAENFSKKWDVFIEGPPATPYEGGKFHIELQIPDNYPFSWPKADPFRKEGKEL